MARVEPVPPVRIERVQRRQLETLCGVHQRREQRESRAAMKKRSQGPDAGAVVCFERMRGQCWKPVNFLAMKEHADPNRPPHGARDASLPQPGFIEGVVKACERCAGLMHL